MRKTKFIKQLNAICLRVEELKKYKDNYDFLSDMQTIKTKYRKMLKEQKYYHIYPSAPDNRKKEMYDNIMGCRDIINDICKEWGIFVTYYKKGDTEFDDFGIGARFTFKGILLNDILGF